MSRALFYVDTVPGVGELAVVDGDEGFHAASVRRIRSGEPIAVSDGSGVVGNCSVEETGKRVLSARVLERWTAHRPLPTVTVVQAIPKSERSELAVELATEAGADEFVAWQAARCVARWDGARADNGLRRWRAVARSAARQSRRPYIPAVSGPVSTGALADYTAERVDAGAVVLVLHESSGLAIADVRLAQAHTIALVVGPEGGVDDDELADLTSAGAHAVRLGPTVLRTSSAAVVALGALGVLTPRWAID